MPARFLVISFQRSGLNWLRYCTEYFSGIRTPGRKQLIADGPILFDRIHDVRHRHKRRDYDGLYHPDGTEVYERVVLLLRDPYDCFASHYLGRAAIKFKKGLEQFEGYAVNITEFDSLKQASKRVFHFEDFVNNEGETFAFLRFFGVDPGARPYNLPNMIEASRLWYRNEHGLFVGQERPKLRSKERASIRRMLERQLGDKFAIYLGRYSLDE
jgi:hypothetical protein